MANVNSPEYKGVEARFGCPMRDVLVTLLSRMSREDAAAHLGCNPNTLDRWLAANALSYGRAYVVRSLASGVPVSPPSSTLTAAILAKLEPAAEVPA